MFRKRIGMRRRAVCGVSRVGGGRPWGDPTQRGLHGRVAVVAGEVAVERLAVGSLGDGVHEQLAADEHALPRRPEPAERLGLVPPASGSC